MNIVGHVDLKKIGALNLGFNNSALDSLRDKFTYDEDDDDWEEKDKDDD